MKKTFLKIKNWLLSPETRIIFFGLVLAGLYGVFYLLRQLLILRRELNIPPDAGWASGEFLALTLIIFLAYYFAARTFLASPRLKIIAFFAGVFSLILLLAPIFASADVYLYVFYPKIWLHYDANPYVVPLANYTSDILYQSGFVIKAWLPYVLAYGPVWLAVSSLFTFWSWNSIALAVFSFKLMALVFFFASTWLVYQILKKISPERKVLGTALFLWSPLILFETVNNGHNDILMVFFCLLAIYFLSREKYFWVLPALALSAMVKYLTLIFAPFFLLYLWRRWGKENKRKFTYSILASLLLAVLFFWPFWQGLKIFSSMAMLASSIYNFKGIAITAFLANYLYRFVPIAGFDSWIFTGIVIKVVFLYFYLRLLFARREENINNLLKNLCWVFLLFVTVLTFYLQSWYFVLPLSLMVLVRDWPVRWFILVSVLGFLNYFFISVDLTLVFILFMTADFYYQRFFKTTKYAQQ